jgi:uncharacterized protein (TIRG00374 family)
MLIGVYFLLPQLGSFRNTFTILRHVTWLWLLVGLFASSLTFLAGAITQFAAGNSAGQLSTITLLQFAGSFLNHFLPFSFGGVDLTARYYQKLGTGQAQAITMGTIPIFFGVITTVIMVAIISPVTLIHLGNKIHVVHLNLWEVVAGIAALAAIGIVAYKYRQRVRKLINEAATALRGVRNTRQLLLLVGGSAAITIFSSFVLYASIRSVHAAAAIVGVFVIYVTASLVSNIAPTPGGIGATEAVLVVGLVAARVSLSQAAAATVLFRLLTFWLPILPGAIALRILRKQGTI